MTMLKELTEDQIIKLSNIQLYNLTFAPLTQDIRKIEQFNSKEMDNSAICVYGATIVPIKRRIEKLSKVVNKQSPRLIIFSGGFGWDGNNIKGVSSKDLEQTWKTDQYSTRVNKRISDVMRHYPVVEEAIMEKMKEMWEEERNHPSDIDFDEYINQFVDDIIEEYMQKMMDDKQVEDYFMKMYKDKVKDGQQINFKDWLKQYIKDIIIRQFILNRCTESDFMQIIWDKVYNKDGKNKSKTIREGKSFVTCENAENCIQILQEYPDINNLIVINEWPYLLRAVLTTKKVADRLGSNISIMGIPADKSDEIGFEFKDMNDYRNVLITQIKKMVEYQDVGDMDITQYLNMTDICEDGPSIKIGDKFYESRKSKDVDRE